MKINEVITEAGILDKAGQAWAGAKGAVQGLKAGGLGGIAAGARAGYQIAGAEQAQSKQIKDITTQVLQKWGAYNQKIKTNTGNDATPEQAVAWLTQFFGGQKPTSQPAGSNPNPVQIQQWLQKEVAGYMANQEMATPPAVDLPDISKLNREELLQLKQQLQAT